MPMAMQRTKYPKGRKYCSIYAKRLLLLVLLVVTQTENVPAWDGITTLGDNFDKIEGEVKNTGQSMIANRFAAGVNNGMRVRKLKLW
jgi:hypothetical protein